MNLISKLLNNTVNVFGLNIPSTTLIFSGVVLGLIIIVGIVTGFVAKKMKNRRKSDDVKRVEPTASPKVSVDDGVYVMNHKIDEPVDDSSDEPEVTENAKSEENETLVEEDFIVEDEELESVDENMTKILENLSKEQDVLDENEYETEDFSDDDMDEYFAKKAKMTSASEKTEEIEEVVDDDFDIDVVDVTDEVENEVKEAEESVEEENEEITEESETEEIAEELIEESETEEVVYELDDDVDVIVPTEEHSTEEEIVFEKADDEPETILPVVETEEIAEETEEKEETEKVTDESEPKEIVTTVEEVTEEESSDEEVEEFVYDGTPVPPPQAIECPNCGTILTYDGKGNFLYCTECFKRFRVPEMYRKDYIRYARYIESEEYLEQERLKEQERIAEEARKKADEEYQEQLRLAEEAKKQSDEEYKEQLRLSEEARLQADREYQEQLRLAEEEKQRQREELEERLKRIEEEKQAQFAQITEESKKLEATRLATEAMLAMLKAEKAAKEENKVVEEVPPEFITDLDEEEPEDDELSIKASKYKRSFKSKLIQSDDDVKKYYAELRNELLSYNKMRCSEAWAGDTYIAGRKTLAKILMGGKTLCLYLSLNPGEFNPNTYHHKDKSASKKYAQTPLQMRIKSDLSMRRAISLIVVMMSDNELEKNPKYKRTDYENSLAYKDDDALLADGLIKLNINAIEVVDKTLDEEDYEQERAEQEKRPKNYREVKLVKKGQVGNISQEDLGKINKTKKIEQTEVNPNATKTGKFCVTETDGDYKFVLYAPQGTVIFESKTFKTYTGARNAIDSFRIAIADPQNSALGMVDGEYIFTIKYTTSYISEPFKTKVAASRALNTIKKTSAVANVEE